MLLHTKPRKFQAGGLTVPSGKIDITWKEMTAARPPAALDLSNTGTGYGRGSSSAGSGATGLPSDTKFLDDQINYWTAKVKEGMASSPDYANSADYKTAAEQLNKWASARAMLETREADYKATAKRLAASTADDFAIFGNKALAKDLTGKYSIVSTDALLTDRVKDSNGNITPAYTPATVGEALRLRYEDPAFSGFNEDTGVVIDTILANAQDATAVDASMDKLFSKAGVIDDTKTFISSANAEHISATDLASLLDAAKDAYVTRTMGTKSNAGNLQKAVSYFSSIMTPEQWQALRSRAMNKFLTDYGNTTVKPADAEKILDDMVNADIAKRASIYLRQATGSKVTGKSSGSGAPEGVSATKVWKANKPALARAAADPSKKVSIEKRFSNTELADHMNLLMTLEANEYSATEELIESAKNSKYKTADKMPLLKRLTENNLTGNFFLGDRNSTPISALHEGEGLEHVGVDLSTSGRNIQVLKDVPVVDDGKGNFSIPWDFFEKLKEWGVEVTKQKNKMMRDKSKGNLTVDEIKECQLAASKNLGGFAPEDRKDVRFRDVQMIPILIDDNFDYDDPVGDVMAAADVAQTKYADEMLDMKKRRVKFTYAFSVMSDNYTAFTSDYYGNEMAVKDPVSVLDLINANKNASKSYSTGYVKVMDIINQLSVDRDNN